MLLEGIDIHKQILLLKALIAFFDLLGEAPNATPFVGPDQAALEAMLAGAIPEQPTATTPATT